MTIDKDFIEKIIELSPGKIHEIDGREFSDKKMYPIAPSRLDCLQVYSITAIEDFCIKELAGDDFKYIIHIASPTSVHVLSKADEIFKHREHPIQAQLLADPFPFGQNLKTDHFIIALQSQFIQDDTTAALLKLVGNLTTTAESKTLDDGVTQTVEARRGISKLEMAIVPNPVRLAPFRTFLEVDQPYSNFVFRINADNHTCALYEADGGAWKNEAVALIKNKLIGSLAFVNEKGKFTILA